MDNHPGSRRPPPDMSGRTSAPVELGPTAGLLNSGPRTSSPSTVDGMPNPTNESEASGVSASSLPSEEPGAVSTWRLRSELGFPWMLLVETTTCLNILTCLYVLHNNTCHFHCTTSFLKLETHGLPAQALFTLLLENCPKMVEQSSCKRKNRVQL
ncbi:hypothetical protein FKM82_017852 [Ascaphus truei]